MAKQSVAELNRIMVREEAILRVAFNKTMRKARSPVILARIRQLVQRNDRMGAVHLIEDYVQEFADELPKAFIRVAGEEMKRIRGLLPRHVLKQVIQKAVWDESKHHRDDHGRFAALVAEIQPGVPGSISGAVLRGLLATIHGKIFGAYKTGDLWHGTSAEALKSIRRQGLIPGSGKGADAWAVQRFVGKPGVHRSAEELLAHLRYGTRRYSVYVASNWSISLAYARIANQITGSSPVILRVRIPAEERDKFVVADELGGIHHWRFIGKIPPQWIDEYRGGSWSALAKRDVHIFYVVIPIDNHIAKASDSDFTELGIDLSFDPADEEAALLMDKSSFDFMRDFSAKQTRAVRAALAQGLRDGDSVDEMARAIRDSIGLTETQWNAVNNYRSLLENSSSESLTRQLRDRRFDSTVQNAIDMNDVLDSDQIDRMVDRYADRMLDYRARMIARTESHRVTSAARNSAWQQMVDQLGIDENSITRTWNSVHDTHTRNTHQELDGQQVQGFDPFESQSGALLLYPGDPAAPAEEIIACRCVESYDFNTDSADTADMTDTGEDTPTEEAA